MSGCVPAWPISVRLQAAGAAVPALTACLGLCHAAPPPGQDKPRQLLYLERQMARRLAAALSRQADQLQPVLEARGRRLAAAGAATGAAAAEAAAAFLCAERVMLCWVVAAAPVRPGALHLCGDCPSSSQVGSVNLYTPKCSSVDCRVGEALLHAMVGGGGRKRGGSSSTGGSSNSSMSSSSGSGGKGGLCRDEQVSYEEVVATTLHDSGAWACVHRWQLQQQVARARQHVLPVADPAPAAAACRACTSSGCVEIYSLWLHGGWGPGRLPAASLLLFSNATVRCAAEGGGAAVQELVLTLDPVLTPFITPFCQ